MDTIRIRAYNVLFGDAFLITFPEKNTDGTTNPRNILIDVGNLLRKGGDDKVFPPVIEDILTELNGKPLDLYVMTHEHLDHVQGLPYAEEKTYTNTENELTQKLNTQYAWLTASAQEGYYNQHPNAKEKHLQLNATYKEIDTYMKALQSANADIPPITQALWLNNNPNKTKDCVKYLSNLAPNTFYVSRPNNQNTHNNNPNQIHPFTEAKIEIWAPEEDTATYYTKTKLMPMCLGVTNTKKAGSNPTLTEVIPPAGVDAGAFYKLVNMRSSGHYENLLAIDKAANNTSIVFCLEWRGYRLLFPGDAEDQSWSVMNEKGVLKPVHFLKISHHGSHTGTPESTILNQILPENREDDDKPRKALLSSTKEQVYQNVPDPETVKLIQSRCDELKRVDEIEPGKHVDIEFTAN